VGIQVRREGWLKNSYMEKIIKQGGYKDQKRGGKKIENKESKNKKGKRIEIRSGEQINEITEKDRKQDIKTENRFKKKKLYENLLCKEVVKKWSGDGDAGRGRGFKAFGID
jgi:hypothetical protein